MESVRRMSTVFLQVRRRSSILEPWRSISRVTCTSCVRMLSSEWTARLDSFPPCSRYPTRSEEHTSELQSQSNLVCRLLLEKKKKRDAACHDLRGCSLAAAR